MNRNHLFHYIHSFLSNVYILPQADLTFPCTPQGIYSEQAKASHVDMYALNALTQLIA